MVGQEPKLMVDNIYFESNFHRDYANLLYPAHYKIQ